MNKPTVWICPKCGAFAVGVTLTNCEHCGEALVNTHTTTEETQSFNEEQYDKWQAEVFEKYAPNYDPKYKQKTIYTPKCPTCGCPYFRRTTALEASYDPASHHSGTAFKSFVCLNCGYAW